MNNYLLTATLIAVFVSISEILIVSGKNGKLVKIVVSLVCVTTLIEPIFQILNFSIDENKQLINYNYTEYLIKTEKEMLEYDVSNLINKNNYDLNAVNVTIENVDGVISTKKVEIILNCKGINCENDHINITNEIQSVLIKEIFSEGVNVDIVVEYKHSS